MKNIEVAQSHNSTDFGDVWYFTNDKFKFAMYRYNDDLDVVYLSNVFVDTKNRGEGYGNYILDKADEFANQLNAKSICLKVKKDSFAQHWYEKHRYKFLTIDEKNHSYIWMIKNN